MTKKTWGWHSEKQMFETREEELQFMAELREQEESIKSAHRIAAERAQIRTDTADRRRARIYAEVFRATLEEIIVDLIKSGVINGKR